MLCLDSYVLLDLLSGKEEKAAKAKKYLLEIESKGGAIAATVLTEVFFHISRRSTHEEAVKAMSFIRAIKNLKVIDINTDMSILAASLRAKYYKNKQREISYLDCIHLATAILTNCKKFITGDKDFEGIEEIEVKVY